MMIKRTSAYDDDDDDDDDDDEIKMMLMMMMMMVMVMSEPVRPLGKSFTRVQVSAKQAWSRHHLAQATCPRGIYST